ncbi:hypothetical protein KTH_08340 [Thermosporothrix hazakensis]|nr:hypothetical protein KTH_08340 [Thermosporothrix hazakensis]
MGIIRTGRQPFYTADRGGRDKDWLSLSFYVHCGSGRERQRLALPLFLCSLRIGEGETKTGSPSLFMFTADRELKFPLFS